LRSAKALAADARVPAAGLTGEAPLVQISWAAAGALESATSITHATQRRMGAVISCPSWKLLRSSRKSASTLAMAQLAQLLCAPVELESAILPSLP
jgi:hypothetical protein